MATLPKLLENTVCCHLGLRLLTFFFVVVVVVVVVVASAVVVVVVVVVDVVVVVVAVMSLLGEGHVIIPFILNEFC